MGLIVKDKTSIGVCMSISGMWKICYITIIDRPLEKVSGVTLFTRSFGLSNTSTEHSAICCYSQFPTTPEDESAVVSQLSQNTPEWLIKSKWDLL